MGKGTTNTDNARLEGFFGQSKKRTGNLFTSFLFLKSPKFSGIQDVVTP